MTNHVIIPDTQVRPGDDTTYLTAIGNFLVKKQPDVIVQIGDFADMPSLSSYDVGKKSFEGRRYIKDIEATHDAMQALVQPIQDYNERQRKNGKRQYKPQMVLTLGNHENRINRAVESDPKLEGVLDISDLAYEKFGWEVHDFLDVVTLDGVAYSHYFVTGVAGRPCTTAAAQLNKKHMSCIAGHQQGLQVAMGSRADGKRLLSIIAGSCYEYEADYMGPQGNKHWRGIIVLHNVSDGEASPMFVDLDWLKSKYA